MKNFVIIMSLLFAFLAASPYAQVPSNARSKMALQKTVPGLQEDFVKSGLVLGAPVYIRIFKEEKILEIWVQGRKGYKKFNDYSICMLSGVSGPKLEEGDGQSPEGYYQIIPQHMNPNSSYHLSMNVGYPNEYDRALCRTGSNIFIHGDCVSIGCFAMTDAVIEKIYAICEMSFRKGQRQIPVHIFPFYMTESRMKASEKSQWYDFWETLRDGYLYFQKNGVPPSVVIKDKKYIVTK